MPSPYSAIARERLAPGIARRKRVYEPIRQEYIHNGIYRAPNRWRQSPKARNVLQRPLQLAAKLPWLPQFNFARS